MEYKFSDKLASLKPSAIREIFKSLTDPTIISFAAGNPSPLSFPVEALSKISADIFANDSTTALQYSITEGYVPLREDVVARLNKKFSIDADVNNTIITSGGQQGQAAGERQSGSGGDPGQTEEPRQPVGQPFQQQGGAGAGHAAQSH